MAKYSYEFKLEFVRYYLSGTGGYKKSAHHFGIDYSQLPNYTYVSNNYVVAIFVATSI